MLLCAHALHAEAGRWVTHEKGLVPSVDGLPRAPRDFAGRAARALGSIGQDPVTLTRAIGDVAGLVEETRALRDPTA